MNYKVLKHKTKPGIFGMVRWSEIDEGHVLEECLIPELYNKDQIIEDIKIHCENKEEFDNYDLIPVQLLTILP